MSEGTVSAALVRELRDLTGSAMMDCKKALVESGGDLQKAREILRLKGLQTADKKAGRSTAEGVVGLYRHHDGKKAVLVELNCETDFVAKNESFRQLAADIAMHVLALKPDYVSREDVPDELVKKEEALVLASDELKSKPEAARPKILEGRMRKFFEQSCLLDQPFVKDETRTVAELLREAVGSLGENIRVARFARIEVGG